MKSLSAASGEDARKSSIRNLGTNIIKSPYNKVDVKDIDFHPKPKKMRIKGFPTDIDINNFLNQLTFKKLSKLSSKFIAKISSLK